MKSSQIKILIINPNSSEIITQNIQKTATEYANGDFIVNTVNTPGAPEYLESYADRAAVSGAMMQLVKENETAYDAFIIAAHCDPNADVIKEITTKPVVSMGEASMKMATMLGHSFSVVSASMHSIPNKQRMIHEYHLSGCCASVRAPSVKLDGWSQADLLLNEARKAVEEDLAEVIVLGSGGMCGLDKSMSKTLGVPVLDGVVCSLIIACGLVKAGLSTSKIRRFSGKVVQSSNQGN